MLGIGRATLYRWLERHEIAGQFLHRIGDRYEVLATLGEGSQGTVYLVRDRAGKLGEKALKLLRAERPSADAVSRLQREFRILALLRHPGLVRVHDFGVDTGTSRPYLVMDRVAGKPFAEAARGRSPAWVAEALAQTLAAVDHLHRAGLVHRDLKSQNVVVLEPVGDEAPIHVVVMDLGLAEQLGGPRESAGGTLLYAAPEVCAGERASARSDLYALGVMAHLALTGRFPFQGETSTEVIAAAQQGLPAPPSTLRPDVPPLLDDVILHLLAADPAQRTPDCAAALEALLPLRRAADAASPTLLAQQLEFVGRDKEVAEVAHWAAPLLERSSAGPSCLAIVGEGGLGKSRLLEACITELRASGHLVALGVCHEAADAGMTPVTEILADALGGADGGAESPRDRLVRRYAPALRVAAPGLPVVVGRDAGETPALSRFQVLDSVASLLTDLAELRPLVIAFDDLHLADAFVLDLVWHLARRGRRLPLKLLVSCEPPPDGASLLRTLLDGAAAEGLTQSLVLGPLDREAVRRIAEQALGSAPAAVLGEQVWRLTGGHPLWVHELLRSVLETGADKLGEGVLSLPRSIQETVRSRLDRISGLGMELLEALAAAGRPAAADELEPIVGASIAHAARDLQHRGVLAPTADGRLTFANSLLRRAIVNVQSAEGRRSWRGRWAASLAGQPGALVERAGHLLAAGAGAGAREEFLAAAEELSLSWQFRGARRFLEAALESFPEDDPARLGICQRLERALREIHDQSGAIKVCEAWAALAQRLGDLRSEAAAQSLLAAHWREKRDWDRALGAAERAFELAEALQDPDAASRANRIRATVLQMCWRHSEALPFIERGLTLSRVGRDDRARAYTLNDMGLLLAVAGKKHSGLGSLLEAQAVFAQIGDGVWQRLAHSNEALILSFLGDRDGAIAVLERAIAELRASGADAPLEHALENLAFLLLRSGRYVQALDAGRDLMEEATRRARHNHRLAALLCLGEAFFQLDERDRAREHHRLAYDLAVVLGEERQRLFAALAQVRDLRADGRLQVAAELAQKVHREAGPPRALRQRIGAALELARIALDEQDAVRAQGWLDDAESAAVGLPEDGPSIKAAMLFERARAWERQGELTLALAAADEALGLAVWHGPTDVEVKLHGLKARIHDRRGEPALAAQALATGAELIVKIADLQTDPVHRSRFVARPDLQAILAAAQRRPAPAPATISAPASSAAPLASLYEIARIIAVGGDIDPLLDRIVQLAAERVGAERALLLLRDEATGDLACAASTGIEKETEADAIRISRSILQKVDQGGSVLVTDAQGDADLREAKSVALFGIRSVMCVPLRVGAEVLGTLYVDERRANAFFSPEDLRFLEALADHAAIGLAYGRLVGRLSKERNALRKTAVEVHQFGSLIGRAPAMRRVFELLEKVAPTKVPVLILGESGTGKELAARALHFNSSRRDAAFLSENCAAIPETLLESILFGHVRGAFTGAERDRKGLFEQADGGSLFLDEVGDMSPGLQAKLLRALQEGEFRPLGGEQVVRADVRVITATHQDLQDLVRQGAFRSDLYFRLNGVTVLLPPLRERREDIPLLVGHLLEKEARAAGREPPRVAGSVMRALISHDWPGNVRQLENTIRRLLLFAPGDEITPEALAEDPELSGLLAGHRGGPAAAPADVGGGDAGEAAAIRRALEVTGGDKEQAAAVLGVSRATFYRRLKRFGLNH